MAKQSAVSAVVARIDADLAKWKAIYDYVEVHPGETKALVLSDDIDKRISSLKEMRAYVTDAPAPSADKPKRGRKPKRGLPTQSETETK